MYTIINNNPVKKTHTAIGVKKHNGFSIPGKSINTGTERAAAAAAAADVARTSANEGILAELGIDTIIGSKRKKHKRYNATTDTVEPETTILGV